MMIKHHDLLLAKHHQPKHNIVIITIIITITNIIIIIIINHSPDEVGQDVQLAEAVEQRRLLAFPTPHRLARPPCVHSVDKLNDQPLSFSFAYTPSIAHLPRGL
jgi:hypothetical protein